MNSVDKYKYVEFSIVRIYHGYVRISLSSAVYFLKYTIKQRLPMNIMNVKVTCALLFGMNSHSSSFCVCSFCRLLVIKKESGII